MKRLLTILLSFMALTCMAQKQNWLENLVNSLSSRSDIDRTVAVNRNPSTREITDATYDFRFSSSNLYKVIASDLRSHSNEVDFYSEETAQNKEKLKIILMRFTDNGHRWSCRLQPFNSKNRQFIVTVTSTDRSAGSTDATGERDEYLNWLTENFPSERDKYLRLAETFGNMRWYGHRKTRRSKSSPGTSTSSDSSSDSDLDELYKELDKAKQDRTRKLSR